MVVMKFIALGFAERISKNLLREAKSNQLP